MDTDEEELSGPRPGAGTSWDSTEAANPSTHSSEASWRTGGRKGRPGTGVAAADAPSSTRTSLRVLRARVAAAGTANEPCTGKPASAHRGRGKAAASRPIHSPVVRTASKKATAMKASKHNLRPKLSKGKGRPPTRASHGTSAFKPEAEMEALSCGEEAAALEESNDEERTRLQQKVVKKEEPEEVEEKKVKKESTISQFEERVVNKTEPTRKRGRQHKDDKAPRQPKRRKKPPVQYVRCEMEGCGTVLAHPRYLQHHIKYQHLLKKKYVCGHPSCGRLFRLQKQLLRHAKHHTDQRDYICEFCARAFKSSHNLAVHRMIHTGEKPIQCEICGFTCRQKASLNWHMKKHDAEVTYQFSCSICGKKFEKKDSVVAHKAKSHPEVLIAEAVAANGGSVMGGPTSVADTVPVLTQPEQPSASQRSQGAVDGALTPLQQVVFPLASQTRIDASQTQFLQLPTHHVVQVENQQLAPTLLQLTPASLAQLSNTSQPQLVQLQALPASTAACMSAADSQSSLLTLSPVATLSTQQAMPWGREADQVAQMHGEGELWDKVIVGEGHQNVGEMIWVSSRERRKEDEGIVWEREGEKQILLQCAEIHGDNII